MSSILGNAVAAAMSAVGKALPELSRKMTADGVTGSVILASSVDKGLDAASSSGANETRRFVAQVSDFPNLEMETLVEVDGLPYLITSLRSTGEAAWFIGLSDEMESSAVIVRGTRREGGRVRTIAATIPALVAEGERGANLDGLAAYRAETSYFVIIRDGDWGENLPPDVGDLVEFRFNDADVSARVSKADHHKGYWLIIARER